MDTVGLAFSLMQQSNLTLGSSTQCWFQLTVSMAIYSLFREWWLLCTTVLFSSFALWRDHFQLTALTHRFKEWCLSAIWQAGFVVVLCLENAPSAYTLTLWDQGNVDNFSIFWQPGGRSVLFLFHGVFIFISWIICLLIQWIFSCFISAWFSFCLCEAMKALTCNIVGWPQQFVLR